MSTRQVSRRIDKIEERVRPKREAGVYTLEELCRDMWRHNEKRYRKKAADGAYSLRYFIPQFEREGRGG